MLWTTYAVSPQRGERDATPATLGDCAVRWGEALVG